MKCDLPEPKKPETQTPMRAESTGSLGLSAAVTKDFFIDQADCLVATKSTDHNMGRKPGLVPCG